MVLTEAEKQKIEEGKYICTMCGHVGRPKTITRGSFFIEIVLWLFFIIPGLIYTIWRLTTKGKTCPTCGNSSMIPLNTPKGLELLKLAKRNPLQDTLTKKPWWKPRGILGWAITIFIIAFFVLPLLIGMLGSIF